MKSERYGSQQLVQYLSSFFAAHGVFERLLGSTVLLINFRDVSTKKGMVFQASLSATPAGREKSSRPRKKHPCTDTPQMPLMLKYKSTSASRTLRVKLNLDCDL
jgi:hypothetical protein